MNGNGVLDANPTRSGQGGANDVTRYRITISYPRIFPVMGFFGASERQEIRASTLLKNQPYARQVRTVVKVCLP